MPALSDRVSTFTDSVIRRMTRISNRYGAINLSQGFPDFDPPKEMRDALARAADVGPHQYSITFGAKNFRDALAQKQGKTIGRTIDPETEIVVLERPAADGPYGAKGPGEMCANPQIPAIANAVFDAVGVRVDTLPITPERVLRAIKAQHN